MVEQMKSTCRGVILCSLLLAALAVSPAKAQSQEPQVGTSRPIRKMIVTLVLDWKNCSDCAAIKQLFETAQAQHPELIFDIDAPRTDFAHFSMPLVLFLKPDGSFCWVEQFHPQNADEIEAILSQIK